MGLIILLTVIGIVAIIVELFVPAGGIVGIGGAGSLIAAVVLVYRTYGAFAGILALVALMIITPLIMVLYFKVFPRSIFGRKLILQDDIKEGRGPSPLPVHEAAGLVQIGDTGKAHSKLRPSGTAVFNGKKYSVVTSGEFIPEKSLVTVVKVEGNRIVVREGEAL